MVSCGVPVAATSHSFSCERFEPIRLTRTITAVTKNIATYPTHADVMFLPVGCRGAFGLPSCAKQGHAINAIATTTGHHRRIVVSSAFKP